MTRYRMAANGNVHAALPGCGDDSCVPVVVIDPEDREQVERLTQARTFAANEGMAPVDATQYALHSLVADPKPDEPQGLGAVVEDARGYRYVRMRSRPVGSACWRADAGGVEPVPFDDLRSVRVLSEGWSE